MREPGLPAIEVVVPDGFTHDVDEHGAHRLRPTDSPPLTASEMRIAVHTLQDGADVTMEVGRAVGVHRISLSDSVVVHADVVLDGYLGHRHWEYVISYRTGLFAQTLLLWFVDVPEHRCIVNILGVCMSEDAPIFHAVYRLIAQQLEFTPDAAA